MTERGRWLLAAGRWSLVAGRWSLVAWSGRNGPCGTGADWFRSQAIAGGVTRGPAAGATARGIANVQVAVGSAGGPAAAFCLVEDLVVEYGNFINGKWTASEGGRTFESHDPATGETIGVVARSSARDVERAVEAAAEAYRHWRLVPAPSDGRCQPRPRG